MLIGRCCLFPLSGAPAELFRSQNVFDTWLRFLLFVGYFNILSLNETTAGLIRFCVFSSIIPALIHDRSGY